MKRRNKTLGDTTFDIREGAVQGVGDPPALTLVREVCSQYMKEGQYQSNPDCVGYIVKIADGSFGYFARSAFRYDPAAFVPANATATNPKLQGLVDWISGEIDAGRINLWQTFSPAPDSLWSLVDDNVQDLVDSRVSIPSSRAELRGVLQMVEQHGIGVIVGAILRGMNFSEMEGADATDVHEWLRGAADLAVAADLKLKCVEG